MTDSSWYPVDITGVLDAIERREVVGPVPSIGARSDGVPLFYRGVVHGAHGEPESGKGWFALHVAAEVIARGERVLYMDFEDTPQSVLARLVALGVRPADLLDRFAYVRPDTEFDEVAFGNLLEPDPEPYAFAVLDGMTEAYSLLRFDPISPTDVARFQQQIARPLADAGAAVLLIDHVVKNKMFRGRGPIGSVHKLAGVGVEYGLDVRGERFSRGVGGTVVVTVEKDRPGHVRSRSGEKSVIAVMHVEPADNGDRVSVRLDPPDGAVGHDEVAACAEMMERVSRVLEEWDGPASGADVTKAVRGNNERRHRALGLLVDGGFVGREDGPRNSHLHTSLVPFRKDTLPAFPDLAPSLPGARSDSTLPLSPVLLDGGKGEVIEAPVVEVSSSITSPTVLREAAGDADGGTPDDVERIIRSIAGEAA